MVDDTLNIILKEMLKLGFLVFSTTATGAITFGPEGLFLGPAALALYEGLNLVGVSWSWISSNPLTKWLLRFLSVIGLPLVGTRLLNALRNLVNFIRTRVIPNSRAIEQRRQ